MWLPKKTGVGASLVHAYYVVTTGITNAEHAVIWVVSKAVNGIEKGLTKFASWLS